MLTTIIYLAGFSFLIYLFFLLLKYTDENDTEMREKIKNTEYRFEQIELEIGKANEKFDAILKFLDAKFEVKKEVETNIIGRDYITETLDVVKNPSKELFNIDYALDFDRRVRNFVARENKKKVAKKKK